MRIDHHLLMTRVVNKPRMNTTTVAKLNTAPAGPGDRHA